MKKQKGMGFLGTLLVVVAGIMIVVTGLRVAPAYIEYFAVKSILRTMASSAEVQGGNPKEIRSAFDKRASMDNIGSIKGEDLDINKVGSDTVVSANYTVKTPLAGNASLVIDFSASTSRK
ncbi:MAG: hypothetical protein RL020_317 [Pseudomonadota bacterium]|jgi:Domain of unknown function (DUF4845)